MLNSLISHLILSSIVYFRNLIWIWLRKWGLPNYWSDFQVFLLKLVVGLCVHHRINFPLLLFLTTPMMISPDSLTKELQLFVWSSGVTSRTESPVKIDFAAFFKNLFSFRKIFLVFYFVMHFLYIPLICCIVSSFSPSLLFLPSSKIFPDFPFYQPFSIDIVI